jgi:hypothetical protein
MPLIIVPEDTLQLLAAQAADLNIIVDELV